MSGVCVCVAKVTSYIQRSHLKWKRFVWDYDGLRASKGTDRFCLLLMRPPSISINFRTIRICRITRFAQKLDSETRCFAHIMGS